MSTTVTLSITGKGDGTDAPTVDDLLDQLRDYFEILNGVAASIATDETRRFEWRITGASKNSPLAFEATAFPKFRGAKINDLVDQTKRQTAYGLKLLQETGERPPYFTENVLHVAERFVKRVTNGLDRTEIRHNDGTPPVVLTPEVARKTITHIQSALEPPPMKPYREYGSIEGVIQGVSRDHWGRPIVVIEHRLTGTDVKCFVSGHALKMIETRPTGDVVWRNRRVEATGTINYRSLGRIRDAEITDLRFMRPNSELPEIDDIVDPDFTGGMKSEDYLENLRSGGHA